MAIGDSPERLRQRREAQKRYRLKHGEKYIYARWSAQGKARKKANLERVSGIKALRGCSDCGERNPTCLDFHHIRDKFEVVSKLIGQGYSWGRIEAEIEKCIVLCRNCHAKRTWKINHPHGG